MAAIDERAPVRAASEIEIAATLELVWEVLTRFDEWPDWNPEVKSMSYDGPLEPGSQFRWKAGPGTIVSTLERVEPPRLVTWTGRTMSIKALHVWMFEPRDSGTRVRTEESFDGFLARVFRGPLRKQLEKSLREGPSI